MKIGILTLPLGSNIGGILQAFALQRALRKMGHEATLVDLGIYPMVPGSRLVQSILDAVPFGNHAWWGLRFRQARHRNARTRAFVRKHMHPRTGRIFKHSTLEALNRKGFGAFVVGSDQIWRKEYTGGRLLSVFGLGFVDSDEPRRIAYAASFGVDHWQFDEQGTRGFKERLSRFDAVSVREKSAVGLCRTHCGVDATFVADPTLLLEPSEYVGILEPSDRFEAEDGLFTYILDKSPEKARAVARLAESLSLRPFTVHSDPADIGVETGSDQVASPARWIAGIHAARFVVTDSFHGCVFAILFNKPFVAIGNAERGLARFESLLGTFGLGDHLVTSLSDGEEFRVPSTDWKLVNERVASLRGQSLEFLKNALTRERTIRK
jgi:hypothetical protein